MVTYTDVVAALVLSACLLQTTSSVSPGVAPLQQLRDGHRIPRFGLGTWLGFTQHESSSKQQEVQRAVEWALEAGYRHVDTASIYDTEEQVGRAVAAKVEDGLVRREDLFITTKLWNDRHAQPAVVPALRDSLRRLRLDYVDLYLIHWPVALKANGSYDSIDYLETWQGMIQAKDLGLAKSIGVSNFNIPQLERLLAHNNETPAVLQVEVNLNLQQSELLAFCKSKDIAVMGYTPFGSLFPSKAASSAPPPRVSDPELQAIASHHNKTVPQVALRYIFELGVIPIPKTVTKNRVQENIDIFDFQLTEEEKKTLSKFDKKYRTIDVEFWSDSPYYPF